MILNIVMVLAGAYLIGSLPFGLWIVKLVRGRDIRNWFSGRTGGTNVMRVAGFWAGFGTALGDVLKATASVLVARVVTGGQEWVEAAAGLLAILGHNYSIFLLETKEGKVRFSGGAGGASTFGAVIGLWQPAGLVILPLAGLIFYFVGYASVATMSVAALATGIFLYRALMGMGPWAYVAFGLVAEALLMWALRPNIQRLIRGEERLVGWRAKRPDKSEKVQSAGSGSSQ